MVFQIYTEDELYQWEISGSVNIPPPINGVSMVCWGCLSSILRVYQCVLKRIVEELSVSVNYWGGKCLIAIYVAYLWYVEDVWVIYWGCGVSVVYWRCSTHITDTWDSVAL